MDTSMKIYGCSKRNAEKLTRNENVESFRIMKEKMASREE